MGPGATDEYVRQGPTVDLFGDLSPDSLLSPTFYDFGMVLALMQWPSDQKARNWHVQLNDIANRALSSNISPEQFVDLLLAQRLEFPSEFSLRRSLIRGLQVGCYLHSAVASALQGASPSMKGLTNSVVLNFRDFGDLAAQTPKQFENQVWPEFRPVAHFWAAFWHESPLMTESPVIAPGRRIPFELTALPRFLKRAEHYRRLGAGTRIRGRGTKGASRVLLPPENSIVLPGSLVGVPTPVLEDQIGSSTLNPAAKLSVRWEVEPLRPPVNVEPELRIPEGVPS
jgi:hypothetical protein